MAFPAQAEPVRSCVGSRLKVARVGDPEPEARPDAAHGAQAGAGMAHPGRTAGAAVPSCREAAHRGNAHSPQAA